MNWLLKKIKSYGDKVAIIHQDEKYTYSDMYKKIKNYRDSDIQNSIIMLNCDYSFYSICKFLRFYLNKNIIVVVNKNYNFDQEHPLIHKLKKENKSGLILFSSGMTGNPKGMIHDLDTLVDSYKGKKERNTTMLLFLLFDHIGGLNTLFNCLSSGITMVIPEKREPEYVCSLIEEHGVNILPTSPTFLALILLSQTFKKYDLSSLRLVTYGTETMTESLLSRLKKTFPNVKFLQTFGTSETGIMKTYSTDGTFMKIDGDYKIVEGELWIRSDTQILGYTNYPMDQFEDGWFKTGDLVEEKGDEIKIIGRTNNIINVGGKKVHPSEVEEVLLQIDGVENCVVYGVKNNILGNVVGADIVYGSKIIPIGSKRYIQDFCMEELDSYKIPVKINFVGKINYTERFKKVR